MADVVKVEHDNGDVSVGFEDEGVFIPVASVSAAKIVNLKERAADLSAKYEENPDDPAVADALGSLPISSKPLAKSKSGNKSESEGGAS